LGEGRGLLAFDDKLIGHFGHGIGVEVHVAEHAGYGREIAFKRFGIGHVYVDRWPTDRGVGILQPVGIVGGLCHVPFGGVMLGFVQNDKVIGEFSLFGHAAAGAPRPFLVLIGPSVGAEPDAPAARLAGRGLVMSIG